MSDITKLYGQVQAQNLLNRSLATGRLAHAYLFRGPEGVGKRLFARKLATAINCKQSNGFTACGDCPSCKKMAAGSHPDFVLLSPEKGAIKIAQVRELSKTLTFAPYEAKTRVVLLEDVHTMQAGAANSLLKTLEEPPENNILILTADSSGAIVQTIISRCQSIPFYALTVVETAEIMMQNEKEMDRSTAMLLARLSEGSPGRGLLLYQKNLQSLWEECIALLVCASCSSEKETWKLLLLAEKMAELKEDLPSFLGLIRLWLRDGLLLVNGCGAGETDHVIRKEWNSPQYFAKLRAVDRAARELRRHCNRTLVCEVLLFRLAS